MTLHDASAIGFSHRPLGTRAVHEKRGADTHEAVLRLDDASVRVSAVQQARDGSYRGTVCAIEPHRPTALTGIAVGDAIAFRALHVFTFAGPANEESPRRSYREKESRERAPRDHFTTYPGSRRSSRAMLASVAVALFGAGAGLGYFLGTANESAAVSKVRAAQTPGEWRLKVDYALTLR